MLKSVARRIKSTLVKTTEQKVFDRIEKLQRSCSPYFTGTADSTANLSILWVTNFNQEPRRFAHDALLILSLRMRGVKIIPVICDQAQSTQCIYHLGKWQDSGSEDFLERRKKLCSECASRDKAFWEQLGLQPISIKEYIDNEEKQALLEKAKVLSTGEWETYVTEEGFPLGDHVVKAILNGEMRGEISEDWRSHANAMASHHIYNVLVLLTAYKKIFSQYRIDRVFGNGGYYYHWDTAFFTASLRNVSFYRAYPIGLRVFTWNYHKNNNELIDLTSAWKTWKEKPLTEDMKNEVERHLLYRGLNIDKGDVRSEYVRHHTSFDLNKPVILILTGVIWDANTLHGGKVYANMYEWLFDTLKWCENHPELQVIVRIHPADNVATNVTGTHEYSFRGEMQRYHYTPSSNVHIVWPEETVETYELMETAALGICYSSTTGLEFCCLGKPMIVLGKPHYANKGFTMEPCSREEYFEEILHCYTQQGEMPHIQSLAYKYWYFYAFHASVDFGLLKPLKSASSWVKRGMSDFESDMKPIDFHSLLPGSNAYLDYVCGAIIHDEEITSEDRWPPLCVDYTN